MLRNIEEQLPVFRAFLRRAGLLPRAVVCGKESRRIDPAEAAEKLGESLEDVNSQSNFHSEKGGGS